MKHNYTPGPWLIAESCKALVIDSTGMKLADCSFSSDANNKRPVKTLKANAKLVAASPALLESCIELLGFIERNFPNEDGEAIIDARAAIQSALSE
ncbi:MAG: hypothetical protein IM618_11315 [Cytophagales bacterium]|nr:hypothetical protein [Cytophagales bacterium]